MAVFPIFISVIPILINLHPGVFHHSSATAEQVSTNGRFAEHHAVFVKIIPWTVDFLPFVLRDSARWCDIIPILVNLYPAILRHSPAFSKEITINDCLTEHGTIFVKVVPNSSDFFPCLLDDFSSLTDVVPFTLKSYPAIFYHDPVFIENIAIKDGITESISMVVKIVPLILNFFPFEDRLIVFIETPVFVFFLPSFFFRCFFFCLVFWKCCNLLVSFSWKIFLIFLRVALFGDSRRISIVFFRIDRCLRQPCYWKDNSTCQYKLFQRYSPIIIF